MEAIDSDAETGGGEATAPLALSNFSFNLGNIYSWKLIVIGLW